MAVVINDFQIITEPPPPPVQPGREPLKPESIRLRPEDVMRIYRHERSRVERVWAS